MGRTSLLCMVALLGCRAAPAGSVAPGSDAAGEATLEPSACARMVKARVEPIPDAPFADDDATLAWTGARALIWDREGRRAAVYDGDRWTSLDDRFPGMRVLGSAGRYVVVAPLGRVPQPLAGLVVDAHTGETRPVQAPSSVLIEPLTIGVALLFSADRVDPRYSDAAMVFDPAGNRWRPVRGPSPAGFAQVRDSGEALGEGFWWRWGGAGPDGVRGDGILIDVRTGARVELGPGGPSPRTRPFAAAEGARVAVWGGEAQRDGRRVALDDGALYEVETGRWTPIPALGEVEASWRGVALTEGYLLVWDRRREGSPIARFDLRRRRWDRFELAIELGREVYELGDDRLLFVDDQRAVVLELDGPRWCEGPRIPGERELGRVDLQSVWTGEGLIVWGGAGLGRERGGCEDHRGPEGCDPWVERAPQASGWWVRYR